MAAGAGGAYLDSSDELSKWFKIGDQTPFLVTILFHFPLPHTGLRTRIFPERAYVSSVSCDELGALIIMRIFNMHDASMGLL